MSVSTILSHPAPDQLCDVCRNLGLQSPGKEIPCEDEPALSHQPSLKVLCDSAQSCALCCQIWAAAGFALCNRGGFVSFASREIGGRRVDLEILSGYIGKGLNSNFMATSKGEVASFLGRAIEPNFNELQWVNPFQLVNEPEKIGSYLFGNWYKSCKVGREDEFCLIGLGVRLGTSPKIEDAVGNQSSKWNLPGTYLRFRTDYDSDSSNSIPGYIRHWDLSCGRAIEQVKGWLQACDTHHNCLYKPQTADSGNHFFPTRVLLVGEGDTVYLKVLKEATGRYIALSHSWGTSHRLTATRSNLQQLIGGIHISDFPQTFRDAIHICRSLGVHYLWIDSLCIIQDDNKDWEIEASSMGAVYHNSYLTISALHAADDSQGCFPTAAREAKSNLKPFQFVSPDVICTGRPAIANAMPFILPSDGLNNVGSKYGVPFSMHGKGKEKYYITYEWMQSSTESVPQTYGVGNFGAPFDPLSGEPLSRRGWVIQERLLSPRTLHYSEGQMYIECQEYLLGEDGSCTQRKFPQLKTLIASRQAAMKITSTGPAVEEREEDTENRSTYSADKWHSNEWVYLVEKFCARKLTVAQDKLVALSGLVRISAEHSGDEYLAGLWKSNLLYELCWERKTIVPTYLSDGPEHDKALPKPTAAVFTRPSAYRAPSWSWAAVDGEILFKYKWLQPDKDSERVARVLEASVTPLGSDPFGQVKSAYLRLETHIEELSRDSVGFKKGQDGWPFHIAATPLGVTPPAFEDTASSEAEGSVKQNPRSLSELFSTLKFSQGDRNSPSTSSEAEKISIKVLFDTEPVFPCTAAFITDTVALALVAGPDSRYRRVGIVEVYGIPKGFFETTQPVQIELL